MSFFEFTGHNSGEGDEKMSLQNDPAHLTAKAKQEAQKRVDELSAKMGTQDRVATVPENPLLTRKIIVLSEHTLVRTNAPKTRETQIPAVYQVISEEANWIHVADRRGQRVGRILRDGPEIRDWNTRMAWKPSAAAALYTSPENANSQTEARELPASFRNSNAVFPIVGSRVIDGERCYEVVGPIPPNLRAQINGRPPWWVNDSARDGGRVGILANRAELIQFRSTLALVEQRFRENAEPAARRDGNAAELITLQSAVWSFAAGQGIRIAERDNFQSRSIESIMRGMPISPRILRITPDRVAGMNEKVYASFIEDIASAQKHLSGQISSLERQSKERAGQSVTLFQDNQREEHGSTFVPMVELPFGG